MSMKLKHVQGELGSEAIWISRKFNNGDWDYWLALELINLKEAMGDESEHKYLMNVSVVSPEAAGPEKLESALSFLCMENSDIKNEEDKVVVLGNNYKKLMKEARVEMEKINMLFGFYMDKQINQFGNTGWDFVSGNIGLN